MRRKILLDLRGEAGMHRGYVRVDKGDRAVPAPLPKLVDRIVEDGVLRLEKSMREDHWKLPVYRDLLADGLREHVGWESITCAAFRSSHVSLCGTFGRIGIFWGGREGRHGD